jgi:signal transduction histidine kinase
MTRTLRFAVLAAGLAFGVFSLAVARRGAGYALGGGSVLAGAAELIAGYALLAVGLIAWTRPRQARLGTILAAASFAWFLAGWATPGAGSPFVFTAGLALYAAAPPVVAHAMLAYPDGHVRWWPGRAGLAPAYAGAALVLGLLAAAVFDPASEGCAQCPRNLLLVDGNSGTYESLNRVGMYLGVACSLLLILLAVAGLIRSAPAGRRLTAPVVAAGCVYLGLVAADYAHSLARGFLGDDPLDRWLWLGQAAALCALSLGVAWAWVRARRTRSALARFVIELAGSPSVGGLRDILAATLHDPSLELAYPLADGRFADARCRPVELNGEVTPIVRGGQQVALLSHRPGLLTEPALAEVAATARLVLENERLQAETLSQLENLHTSRRRIVQASDAARRQLGRDLHDGAQQRLVTLTLALRLAATRLGPGLDAAQAQRINQAEAELRAALADLRELAQGIFPAMLAEEGLATAIEALAEAVPVPLTITALPGERFGASVEAAAYFVVAETVRQNAAGLLQVCAARRDGHLVVEVAGDSAPGNITDLEDRVGALGGSVMTAPGPEGRAMIRAEIPCES